MVHKCVYLYQYKSYHGAVPSSKDFYIFINTLTRAPSVGERDFSVFSFYFLFFLL